MLENKTVTKVRRMTDDEQSRENWSGNNYAPCVIVFEDGTRIHASRDPEGNGPGALMGWEDTQEGDRPIRVMPVDEM